MVYPVPALLKRVLSALGFAAFIALQVSGLWHGKRNLAYTVFTAVYLMVVALLGIAIDRALAKN